MKLAGKILCLSVKELVAVGCENGWFYLIDPADGKIVWNIKLSATYYRGPFTDVNIISVDLNDLIAIGTDFADGKVYVFDLEGRKLWEEQFMSVMGCWERPNDVVAVAVKDGVAVCEEWMNAYLRIYDKKGKLKKCRRLRGFVRKLVWEDELVVGTTESTYVGEREINVRSDDVRVRGGDVYCSNDREVFKVDGWRMEFKDPVFDVGDVLAVCDSEGLHVLSLDGELLEFRRVERAERVFVLGDEIVLAYPNRLVWNGREIRVKGHVVHVGDFVIGLWGNEIYIE